MEVPPIVAVVAVLFWFSCCLLSETLVLAVLVLVLLSPVVSFPLSLKSPFSTLPPFEIFDGSLVPPRDLVILLLGLSLLLLLLLRLFRLLSLFLSSRLRLRLFRLTLLLPLLLPPLFLDRLLREQLLLLARR